MRKLISLFVGLGIGSLIGMIGIALFSPVSSDEFRANLKAHYERALEAGRKASLARRAELEKEIQDMKES